MTQVPVIYIGDGKSVSYYSVPGGMQIQMLDEQKNIIFEGMLSSQQQGTLTQAPTYQHGFDSKRKVKASLILVLSELTEVHPDLVHAANLMKEEKRREQSSVTIEADNERGYRIIDSYTFDPLHHALIKDEALSTVLSTAKGK